MKSMGNVILHKLIQYSAYIKLYRPLGHIRYKKIYSFNSRSATLSRKYRG
jgi:hypothetical protein